jgi:cell division protein FtsB
MSPLARTIAAALFGMLLLTIPRWVMENPRRQELEDTAQRVDALRAEVEALRAENERLMDEVEALSNDPWTLEQRAREEHFYVKDDEVVLVFREPGPSHGANDAAPR